MSNLLKSFLVLLLGCTFVLSGYSQGADCFSADPFCTNSGATFPASTNTSAGAGPDYGCLGSQPNPAWYYLQISQAGNLDITLTNSNAVDIDFICWGPFPDQNSPCNAGLNAGAIVDCSFSTAAVETINIPNAQVGEVYIVMITNFSGVATDISANQTGGTGATDCSIVTPCFMTSLNVTISACDFLTDTYSNSGTITFTDPPTTGQLIVTDCHGNTDVFNAPFTSPINYNIPNLPADGIACDVTATFTDDPTCTIGLNYNAPPSCACTDDAGTVTASMNGQGNNNFILCDGDIIDIATNGDTSLHNGATSGLTYAIYSCPPTTGYIDPATDPCFVGFVTGTLDDMSDQNVGGSGGGLLAWLIANQTNPGNPITNNELWFAPMTLIDTGTLTYDLNCVHIGAPTQVQYLEPITYVATENCANGTWDIVINGGYPDMYGGNFTISNLVTTPNNPGAALSTTSVANGGTVSVTGLNFGETFTFDVTDANGCTITVQGGPYTCCSDQGGTVTANLNGSGTNNYILCDGDIIEIFTNGDTSLHGANADITYAIYSCPPTTGYIDPATDPCFVGFVTGTLADMTDQNVGGSSGGLLAWLIANQGNPGNPITNNTLWFSPLTLIDSGTLTYDLNCVNVGVPTEVTYLEPIVTNSVADCQTGTVTVTITGGYPEMYPGNNYNLVNTGAGTLSANQVTFSGGTVTITGLVDGDMYSFTITDDNGCPMTFAGGPFVGLPNANAGVDDFSCTLSYNLNAIPSVGTGTWTGPGNFAPNANTPNATVTVAAPGTYTFTWTEDNTGGCISADDVTIAFSDLTLATNFTDPTCGNTDGDITVNAGGGIGNIQYSNDNGATFQASNVFNNLGQGSYDIVIQDDSGCVATVNVVLTDQGGATIDSTPINDPSCNGVCDGDITINITGGTSPHDYSIDGGGTFQTNNNFFNGLCAGVYDIVVRDANGCVSTTQVTLTDPPVVTYTAILSNLTCYQDGSGSIDITGGGGDGGPYQYSIDNGATFQASGLFNGLAAGTYDIVVQDGNGCTVTGQETIIEPTELTITFSSFDATCNGICDGYAIVIPAGGVSPYTYTWSSSANNTPTENNLCAGTYDLIVTDDSLCTVDTLSFPINEPVPVAINNVTATDELCNGNCDGTITIDAPAATQFSIDNGTTFQASNTFNGLCAGNYDIVVQDANGCPATTTAIVNSPAPLSATVSNDTTICTGGTATLTAGGLGGTTPYTYLWDDPNASTTATITTTVAGTFNVTVTDDNGCTAQATVTVAIAPPLTVTALTSQSICPGDQVTISAIGGGGDGGPYNYDWTNDDGSGWTASGQFQTVAPTVTTTYTVTVSDNCGSTTTTDQITITVNQEPVVNFSADNLAGCTPVTTTFTNLTDPLMTGTCYWDFGDGNFSTDCNPTHTYTIPGCYDVTLTVYSPDNCVSDTTFTQMICVYAYPQADFLFGPQPTNVLNPTINFANTSTGAISYEWIFDNLGGSNEEHPSFTFPDDGPGGYDVCLVATSANDCVDTICYRVIIDDLFLVYVPNAFTPDGDGDNDYFFPVVSGIEPLSYQFLIYDRWGELIFESRHPELQWGGSVKGNSDAAKQDVYVWKLIVTDGIKGEQHEFIGHVTLLR